MEEQFTCPECGDDFDQENSLQQHRRAKHGISEDQEDRSILFDGMMVYSLVVVGLCIAGYVLLYWIIPWANQKPLPTQNNHWHARYRIELCGEKVPQRPYSQGDVHTHGKGQIHVHPHSSRTAGKNANLKAFFESFNATLTDTKISIPMVGTYKNGDECNGEPGEVAVYVNGETISNPSGYVPRDGEFVRITFEAKSD